MTAYYLEGLSCITYHIFGIGLVDEQVELLAYTRAAAIEGTDIPHPLPNFPEPLVFSFPCELRVR